MRRWWLIAALLIAALVLGWAQTHWPEPLRVTFFDIGQGDATLIRTPAHQNILIDGGPDSSVMAKLGRALPWTDHTIDLVVLSHPHADHVSGLVPVLEHYQVRRVLMTGAVHTAPQYLEFLKLIKDKHIPVTIAQAGQHVMLAGGVTMDLFWPAVSYVGVSVDDLNDTSIINRVALGERSILFTGDTPAVNEAAVLASGVNLRSDILKVAHQGSKTSSTEVFLQAVSPEFAVISVGKNTYGHPSPEVVVRLKRLVPHIYRTDQAGDVTFVLRDGHWTHK